MEPLMLPIKTILPFAFRSIWDWSASSPKYERRRPNTSSKRGREQTHQMPRNRRRKEIRPVDIDPPQLPHPVDRVRRRLKVLRKPRRRHKVVNLAVGFKNLCHTRLHRRLVRNIRIVRRDPRQPISQCQHLSATNTQKLQGNIPLYPWILLLKRLSDQLGLLVGFVLYTPLRQQHSLNHQPPPSQPLSTPPPPSPLPLPKQNPREVTKLTIQVNDSQIGPAYHHPLPHHQPQSPRATGHHAHPSLQRKRRERREAVRPAAGDNGWLRGRDGG